MAHIATRNQDEFTLSFILRRKLIFLFFEEAVQIWSLCELCWSFGLQSCQLVVFYNQVFISGSKFLSPSVKAVVRTCACAISLDHFDFRLVMFGSHSQNQDEFTVSFILRGQFIFLIFKEAYRIWSLCYFSWLFCFRKQTWLPFNEGSC